ncbi:MAG TPA: glycosyltransferase family 39 protein, partial [Pyrinomonadaceae bacterium]|nr:glycosyltransferase family 39 protein [Pyrinomonadaceae bacterium]
MRLKHLLLFAACLHLAAAVGAYWAGRTGAFPGTFEPDGVASFASDGFLYRRQVVELEAKLKDEDVAAWVRARAAAHVKLYSLSFALFSPLFGPTILSAEPLNLFYYLATLFLIYAVGREAYDRRAGLLASAAFAALCPTFLMHTTQLLKDPAFVVLALALMLVCLKLLGRDYDLRGGLLAGLAGGGAAAALWVVRSSMWWVVLAVVMLACVLSVARQARARVLLRGNLAGAALMLALALCASHLITTKAFPQEPLPSYEPEVEETRAPEDEEVAPGGLLSPVVKEISST